MWGWSDGRTIASLAAGVAGVVGAVQRSWRTPVPAIETALWKHRTFALSNVASAAHAGATPPRTRAKHTSPAVVRRPRGPRRVEPPAKNRAMNPVPSKKFLWEKIGKFRPKNKP